MVDLAGKVALVTGAAGGIGLATARRLGHEGATVIAVDVDEMRLREAWPSATAAASVRTCDISRSDEVNRLVDEVTSEYGPVDILINSAGIYRDGAALDTSETDFDLMYNVNVKGTFLMSQAAARTMVSASIGGSIVNIASIAADLASPLNMAYGATKGAVLSLTRGFAVSLGAHAIRVNAIAPGPVETAMAAQALVDPAYSERMLGRILLGRLGTPDEIAKAAVFLASDDSSWITGSCLTVDGGVRALR